MAKKTKIKKSMRRRDFLKYSSMAGATLFLDKSSFLGNTSALGQGNLEDKFIFYIHCGSWDGWASGLMQARDIQNRNLAGKGEAVWPLGAFTYNRIAGGEPPNKSVNPNINTVYKRGDTGALLFNNYTRILTPIAQHMCFAVGNPQSADHNVARAIQYTGSSPGDDAASWIAGFAQMTSGSSDPIICADLQTFGGKLSSRTQNVTLINTVNQTDFNNNFKDHPSIPKSEEANLYWDVVKDMNSKTKSSIKLSETTSRRMNSFLSNLVYGDPNITDSNPLIKQINQYFTRSKINTMIDDPVHGIDPNSVTAAAVLVAANPASPARTETEASKVKNTPEERLLNALKLAAFLAETGTAKGMAFEMDNQDYHSGSNNQGSSLHTARIAAQTFAQIRLFWEWLGSRSGKNLQDRVLIVMSHEFSRTAYNSYPMTAEGTRLKDETGKDVLLNIGKNSVWANGAKIENIDIPGVDHWLSAMGTIFINGKVPPASRLGGIVDNYVAHPSTDLNGTPDPSLAGYTQLQLVGSMLMRVFPDIFPDQRAVRQIWPTMPDPISLLVNV